MDKRTLAIIAALVFPVIVMAFIATSMPKGPEAGKSGTTAIPDRLPSTKSNARPDDRKRPPPPRARRQPLTLEQARERAKKEMERLDTLTPEQWEAEQRARMERHRGRRPPPPPKPGR